MTSPTSPPLRLGIVGCGGAALDVVAAAGRTNGVSIVAVHDRAQDLAADLAARTGAAVLPTLDTLLADSRVEAVYVALPHDLLAPVAEATLRAGRHVLVEKPVALEPAGIRVLAALAHERGLALGAMFELRYSGAAILARRLVRDGAIGSVRQVRIRTLIDKRPGYWDSGVTGRATDGWRGRRDRAGGGVVLMNSIHQLDLVAAMTGDRIVRMSGEIASTTEGVEVEDAAVGTFRLAGGALGSLAAAAHSPGSREDERIEIDGSLGRLDLPDPYAGGPARLYVRRGWRGLEPGSWHDVEPPPADPFGDLLTAFARAVRRGDPAPVGAAEAEAALAAVRALYRSAETGRAVAISDLGPAPA
ncbi:MAG TPA: Gfo/Idh/MocA family oxidoreductase [Candidatus Limnocylindrales bacterium]|nr:Gfo/Idh/MocA family oxidoreductase [Candidatus Limnocylindrales bacterium]